jgi:hypothetical protein
MDASGIYKNRFMYRQTTSVYLMKLSQKISRSLTMSYEEPFYHLQRFPR